MSTNHTAFELISEVVQLLVDLLKHKDEREAIHSIRDFRQQIQSQRDAVDDALKKKHGVSE